MTTAPVRCRVPPFFTPVDLAASPDVRARGLLPPGADPALERHLETFAEQMRANGACYAAIIVDPSVSPGYFAITQPADAPPTLDALAVRLASPSGETHRVELPCGPALTVTEHASFTTPDGRVIPVVQEHALVVHPAGGQVVAFTLGIADDQRRSEHAGLFAEILDTISFAG